MQVDLALLADYAAVTNDKKLIAAGIFSSIRGRELPVVHSRMYLALRVRVIGGEADQHHFTVRLVGPDGAVVMDLSGPFEVQRADRTKDATLPLVIDIAGQQFEKWGPHSFDIYVDERFVERVELEVGQLAHG